MGKRGILSRVLGRLLRPLVKPWRRLGLLMLNCFGRNATTSRLYYAIFSPAFAREASAFLNGRHQYETELQNPAAGFALLRRNTHRLEKGLLMRPRRDVFALEYISETVDCYVASAKNAARETPSNLGELQWSHDVLKAYFEAVQNDPIIDQAQEKFRSTKPIDQCSTENMVPYQRELTEPPSVSFAALLQLSKRRRSVRWFLEKTVDRKVIENALDVATQAPSACNRQPYVFRVFDDPKLVQQVAALPMGTGGYSQNIPVIVVLVGQQRNYFDERDRHLIYIDTSLAAMSFIFAIESQGLSTCCINWPDVDYLEQKMSDLLHLEDDERVIMCLAVGHPDPDALVAYSQKKQGSCLRRYNFE